MCATPGARWLIACGGAIVPDPLDLPEHWSCLGTPRTDYALLVNDILLADVTAGELVVDGRCGTCHPV